MKTTILTSLLAYFTFDISISPSDTERAIKEVVMEFMEAADAQDVERMEAVLDPDYRIVMNQLFGSDKTVIMNRETYLQKINSNELGGDHRSAVFRDMLVNGHSATVLVLFKGEKRSFTSLLTLIQDARGTWKLISDVPVLKE